MDSFRLKVYYTFPAAHIVDEPHFILHSTQKAGTSNTGIGRYFSKYGLKA